MKILIFTHIFPFPLDEGGKTAQFNFIERAALEHEIILVPLTSGVDTSTESAFLKTLPAVRIERVYFKDLTPNHTFFQKVARKLIWWLRKLLPKVEQKIINNQYFLNPVPVRNEDIVLQINQLIAAKNPDIIQVDFIDNADLGCIIPKNYHSCLILHDLRSESVKQYCKQFDIAPGYQEYLAKNVSYKELPYMQEFDSVITFNEYESDLVRKWNPNVIVNSFAVSNNYLTVELNNQKLKNIVFLGSDTHFPNADGLHWFAKEVGSRLFERFGLHTKVIGHWNDKREEFRIYPFITFLGFKEDLKQEMRNSILVVPIRIGSGVRTKILEAFAMGVPVISSAKGMDGINAVSGIHYLKADSLEEYEIAVSKLLNDQAFVQKMREAARIFVRENFSQERATKDRIEFYRTIAG